MQKYVIFREMSNPSVLELGIVTDSINRLPEVFNSAHEGFSFLAKHGMVSPPGYDVKVIPIHEAIDAIDEGIDKGIDLRSDNAAEQRQLRNQLETLTREDLNLRETINKAQEVAEVLSDIQDEADKEVILPEFAGACQVVREPGETWSIILMTSGFVMDDDGKYPLRFATYQAASDYAIFNRIASPADIAQCRIRIVPTATFTTVRTPRG